MRTGCRRASPSPRRWAACAGPGAWPGESGRLAAAVRCAGAGGMSISALYTGTVVHTRLRPVRHRLRYRMLMLLLDLDELPALSRRLRLFSPNASTCSASPSAIIWSPAAGPCARRSRRRWPRGDRPRRRADPPAVHAAGAGQCVQSAQHLLLPWARRGAARDAVRGEQHLRRAAQLPDPGRTARPADPPGCAKEFYVSPFMDMEMRYHFRLIPPGERLGVAIEVRDEPARS